LSVTLGSTGWREIEAKTENRANEPKALRWQDFHNVFWKGQLERKVETSVT